MADFFWFSDSQWARIEPHLPMDVRGKKRVDDRRVLSGIVHALKCGGRWADCADVYGPKKTLYNRFVRWAEHGIWEDIFSALAAPRIHWTGYSSTAVASRSTAAPGVEKGGLGSSATPKAAATPSSMPSAMRRVDPASCS
jgi:mannitol 2-dehydrogenase